MDSVARHQCIIYENSPSDSLKSLAKSIIASLQRNRRCLYLNSPAMVAGMRGSLMSEGLDLQAALQKGSLILTSDQGHLTDSLFDVEKMMDMLRAAVAKAQSDGYEGLWASGDMTWELGGEKNHGKLLEYEQRLDDFMQNEKFLSGVCQYHRTTLPPHAIDTAFSTHPAMYINETLSHLNSQYKAKSA